MPGNRVSPRTSDRLKDEVYRQMLRVEAGRSTAQLPLALALLQAWITLDRQSPDSEARQWLRAVSPLCLRMIDASLRADE